MKNTKLKQCPNCKNMVEKADGCNAIACRCGIQFCFVCGKQIQAAGCEFVQDLGTEVFCSFPWCLPVLMVKC